jgi:hypothetical protein
VTDGPDVPDVPGETDLVDARDAGAGEDAVVLAGVAIPRDGRLYAAAGSAVITPTAEAHPCPVYLAGTRRDRLSAGVHDDLYAKILVLGMDGRAFVLVELDLVGVIFADVARFAAALEALGLPPGALVVASTHTHAGPDTVGLWGPDVSTSGRCPAYLDFLVATVAAEVAALAPTLVPVTLHAGETSIDEPGSEQPTLMTDIRHPDVVHNRIGVAAFRDDQGATVATLVNWHEHPEVLISSDRVTADFPQYLRRAVERALGGTCVYLSGTLGGLQTPFGFRVRQYTEDGQPVLVDGQPAWAEGNDEERAWSLGYVVAEYALAALAAAQPVPVTELRLDAEAVVFPLTNPAFYAAEAAGLIGPLELEKESAPECRPYGCLHHDVPLVSLGTLHLLAIPGEALPESSIGREVVTIEYEPPYGPYTYPAMTGWRAALPPGHTLLEVGLANDEIGYLVPATDWLTASHPNYYCESVAFGQHCEARLRTAVEALLGRIER